jgi:hypothetical protein
MSEISKANAINVHQLNKTRAQGTKQASDLEKQFEAERANAKANHQQSMDSVRMSNNNQIEKETLKKEKLLEELRGNLQTTQQITEKQLAHLHQDAEAKKIALREKMAADREQVVQNHELNLEDLNHRFNDRAQKANEDGQKSLEQMNESKNSQIVDSKTRHEQTLSAERNRFTERYERDKTDQKIMKDAQVSEFDKDLNQTNQLQQKELTSVTTGNKKQVEMEDKKVRQQLDDQNKAFEKKYADTFKANSESFKNLQTIHTKAVNKMKEDLTKDLVQNIDRSDDPFYQFTKLNPTMSAVEGGVEIRVPVAEHSKADIQLTLNGKVATVSFNRRYSDQSKLEGTSHKVTKVESFTTALTASQMLNPKTLQRTYEDGVMVYKVKYA